MNKKKKLKDKLNNKDILISDLKNLIKILQVERELIKNLMITKEKDTSIYLFFCLN